MSEMREQGQNEMLGPTVDVSLATKAGIIALPGAVTLLIDILAHGGYAPVGITGVILACIACNSPKIAETAGKNKQLLIALSTHDEWRERLDRLSDGYFTKQILKLRQERPELFGAREPHQAMQWEDGHRKATVIDEMEPLQPARPRLNFHGEDELLAPRSDRSGVFLFSEVLQSFTPSLDKIYIGTLATGEMVFCKAEDLCHVALAGATQGGKSSLQRMLLAQLCYAGATVLILNPHHSKYILAKKEDWTPFDPFLKYDPMKCKSYDIIEHFLRQVATVLLPTRLDRFANGEAVGKPYFIALDELPDIVKHLPNAAGYLDDILRQGAKLGIFLMCASQDFLVKTLKMEGGAVRACYRSAFYVGGDATTAKILLDMPANQINESTLGKGTIMLRNWMTCKQAQLAYVPYVDNAALYRLLGPSTYVQSEQPREHDEALLSYSVVDADESVPEPRTATQQRLAVRVPEGTIQQRRMAREQALRLRGRQPAGSEPSAHVQPIKIERKPEPSLDDAILAYNKLIESGVRPSRYNLKDALLAEGFECGENRARQLLEKINGMVNG